MSAVERRARAIELPLLVSFCEGFGCLASLSSKKLNEGTSGPPFLPSLPLYPLWRFRKKEVREGNLHECVG